MISLIYATRRSKLALAQARALIDDLRKVAGEVTFEEKQIVTMGDRIQDRPLSEVGGKGLFVKEIEEALLAGEAHFAIHSVKDVPSALPSGLSLVCIPKREDPRDALIAPKFGTLASLPAGARVGTSSLRRMVSLRRARPDLEILPLRGNVDTRMRRVDEGDFDAIVLAAAGLRRLGLESRATDLLAPEVCLPAIGQGALGLECAEKDDVVRGVIALVDDPETHVCVEAERGVMRALEGNCQTPLAAYAVRNAGELHLRAWVSANDGSAYRSGARIAAWPGASAEAFARAYALGLDLGNELRLA
jgi:hydroxymethylbilane synthase